MKSLIIFGIASNRKIKELEIPISISDGLSLMDFLTGNNITIASSCGGVGACSKCIINQNILSCQISLKDFLALENNLIVEIAYL